MTKRRGNGEGSITRHKKSGLYMARYTVQTPTGPKRKTIYGKKGEKRQDVADRLAEALGDRSKGLVFESDNVKLGEYMALWLADSVRDTVRRSTFVRYEQITRLHIVPTLGRTKLKNLTPANAAASTDRSSIAASPRAPSSTFTPPCTRPSSRTWPTA